MIQVIVACGDLSARRPGSERTRIPVRLPAERLGQAHSRHAGRISAIFGADAFARVQGFGGRQATTGHRSPISFLGSARVQLRQKSPRCIADRFQVDHSLRDAPASEMQEITEGIPDERKPTARDGNLTARERKNAC